MRALLVTFPQRALIAVVRGYRFGLSPWLGSACRFTPTCSAYSLEALERHGAAAGTALTLHRIARCHPFCIGGHDPVPGSPPKMRGFPFPRASTSTGHLTSTNSTSP